jgi:hypothetical protein
VVDPESYTGGSVANGKLSHGGHVKGDDPKEKLYHSLSGCGLGLKLATSPPNILF